MKWLVACECSAIVRDALRALGHDAWSCDLKPCERDPRWHIQGDVLAVLGDGWDGMIAHPDCTYLTVANNGPMARGCSLYSAAEAQRRRSESVDFFMRMVNAPIPHIAVENPIGVMSSLYRRPHQIVQPYQFGNDASKATCLWLKRLPRLRGTAKVSPRMVDGRPRWGNQTDGGQNKLGPDENRKADRARTYQGVADAMAAQWGSLSFPPPPLFQT